MFRFFINVDCQALGLPMYKLHLIDFVVKEIQLFCEFLRLLVTLKRGKKFLIQAFEPLHPYLTLNVFYR